MHNSSAGIKVFNLADVALDHGTINGIHLKQIPMDALEHLTNLTLEFHVEFKDLERGGMFWVNTTNEDLKIEFCLPVLSLPKGTTRVVFICRDPLEGINPFSYPRIVYAIQNMIMSVAVRTVPGSQIEFTTRGPIEVRIYPIKEDQHIFSGQTQKIRNIPDPREAMLEFLKEIREMQ